jgi:excisionase family DNA binding protein
MGDDYISLEEAARQSGLHPNTLRRLLRLRKLKGYKQGWFWLVSASSLKAYADPITGYLLEQPGPKPSLTPRDKNS